jgi:hypothetical protein
VNDEIDPEWGGINPVQALAYLIEPRRVPFTRPLIERRKGAQDSGSAGLDDEIRTRDEEHGRGDCGNCECVPPGAFAEWHSSIVNVQGVNGYGMRVCSMNASARGSPGCAPTQFAFATLRLDEVVSFTTATNPVPPTPPTRSIPQAQTPVIENASVNPAKSHKYSVALCVFAGLLAL